jgi:hypothetical protein
LRNCLWTPADFDLRQVAKNLAKRGLKELKRLPNRAHSDEQVDVTHDLRKDQRRNLIHAQRFVDLFSAGPEGARTVASAPACVVFGAASVR